jgi:anti-sigma factor RsiW
MSCNEIDLLEYQFETLEPDGRDQVEEHLKTCTACLSSYFALKNSLQGDARPSAAARDRLRAAVAKQLRPPWRWWEPTFAFASALLVVFLSIAATWQISVR